MAMFISAVLLVAVQKKTISVKQRYISFTSLNMSFCNDCSIWMHCYETLYIGSSFKNLPEFASKTWRNSVVQFTVTNVWGKTVNKEMYADILCRHSDAVRRKRSEKWRTNSWFLSHDNAPKHRSVLVKDFLTKNNVTALEHPPYAPGLAPADFYLFPRLKSALKRRCWH